MYGTVTRYYHDRNYGFILGEDNKTYFLHESRLNGEYVNDNYFLSFEPFINKKGRDCAKNIMVIEAPERKRNNGSTRKKHERTIKSNAAGIIEND